MICQECGMDTAVNEYHPYAACLIFKGCHDAEVTRANMDLLIDKGYRMAEEKNTKRLVTPPPPRYDSVFYEGLAKLNNSSQEGEFDELFDTKSEEG